MNTLIRLRLTNFATALTLVACTTTADPPDASFQDAGMDAAVADAAVADAAIADAGGETVESCFAGLLPGSDNFVNTLDLESVDPPVRLLLARERGSGDYVGETFPYRLVRFAIQRGDAVECITASSALEYQYAHHNWDEEITAMGSSTYQVDVEYSFVTDPPSWMETLSVDGGDPIPLSLRACETLPATDLNHCLGR